MKKILVVEDNPDHLREAIEVGKGFDIEVVTATFGEDGEAKMLKETGELADANSPYAYREREPVVDGVITDIFIPLKHPSDETWGHSDDPVGVMIAVTAKHHDIPVVYCTDGDHHGPHHQWIYRMKTTGVLVAPMVDSVSKGTSKEWKKAFEKILYVIRVKEALSLK